MTTKLILTLLFAFGLMFFGTLTHTACTNDCAPEPEQPPLPSVDAPPPVEAPPAPPAAPTDDALPAPTPPPPEM